MPYMRHALHDENVRIECQCFEIPALQLITVDRLFISFPDMLYACLTQACSPYCMVPNNLRRTLSDKRIVNRGYVLDGFPKGQSQAKWALMEVVPMSEEEVEAKKKVRSGRVKEQAGIHMLFLHTSGTGRGRTGRIGKILETVWEQCKDGGRGRGRTVQGRVI